MKSVLVKLGGSVITDKLYRQSIIKQLIYLSKNDYNVCVVHGGGKLISHYFGRLGIKSKFYEGLRITPVEALDVVMMVLVGKVNKDIVKDFNDMGVNAIGLCGGDGALIKSNKLVLNNEIDLGQVGTPIEVNQVLYEQLTALGYVLVIATIAIGDDGYYNVNADHTAAFVAREVKATHLIYVSDVDGVMNTNTNVLYSSLNRQKISELKEQSIITEGMLPKLHSCLDALENGVSKVMILNGKKPDSILEAVVHARCSGTEIVL